MAKSSTAGARALKTRLGSYLRKVRNGTTIVVTDRGEPIAELRPLELGAGSPGLDRLVATGVVTRATTARLRPFRPIRSKGPSLAEAVREDREDRF